MTDKSSAPQAPAAPVAEALPKMVVYDPDYNALKALLMMIEAGNLGDWNESWRAATIMRARDCVDALRRLLYAAPLAAPPAPTLEGIEALIEKWRDMATTQGQAEYSNQASQTFGSAMRAALYSCADQLEQVLQHITPMQATIKDGKE